MITFIDLAGHHKYLKTTIFGLTSYCPDFAMLVVSANTGIGEYRLIYYNCECLVGTVTWNVCLLFCQSPVGLHQGVQSCRDTLGIDTCRASLTDSLRMFVYSTPPHCIGGQLGLSS